MLAQLVLHQVNVQKETVVPLYLQTNIKTKLRQQAIVFQIKMELIMFLIIFHIGILAVINSSALDNNTKGLDNM